jgi:hypothetical protein
MTKDTLTIKELITELHKLGFTDINERRLRDWKDELLLPNFDEAGQGFGKGKGKAPSRWRNKRSVIEQAVWVYRLRRVYRYTEELYFPLWLLNFPIPVELVRESLIAQLEHFRVMFETEAVKKLGKVEAYERTNGIVEDFIGDLVFNWIKKDKFPEIFGTPQAVVEVPMNIFFNSNYELDDVGFEDGLSALEGWKEAFETEIMPLLAKGLEDDSKTVRNPIAPSGIEMIFENAAVIQEYLSVPNLLKSVSEASEEDFHQTQLDMQVVRSIVDGLGRTVSIMMKDLNDFLEVGLESLLPVLFTFGNLLVLTDIAMRRKGWSERFNWARGEIIKKVKEDFDKVSEETLLRQDPQVAGAFKKGLKTLKKNIDNLVLVRMQTPQNC